MGSFAFIGDGASITTNEQSIVDTIVAGGHTYSQYGRDTDGSRPLTGRDFLVLGPEGSSTGFNAWVASAQAASMPILHMFHNSWDEAGLHATFGGQTSTPTAGAVRTHPITTLSGLTVDTVYNIFSSHATTDRVFNVANLGQELDPASQIVVIIDDDSSTGRKMMVAVDAGGRLADGVTLAHARMVGFGPASVTWATNKTADGILMMKAAADWVSGINPSGGDTTAPTVSVQNPINGDTASGSMTLRASAADDVALSTVTFSVDGGSAISATLVGDYWEATLDTTALSDASHTVTATALDTSSNSTTSSTVTFTVDNTVPPPVYLYKGAADINTKWKGLSGLLTKYLGVTPLAEFIDDPATPPVGTASFGPNGTHYPSSTPALDATFVYDVEVAATFTAIQTALNAAPSSGNARIRVQPGTFPVGNGANSGDTPVLSGGVAGRSSKVLIVPRDGWDTVHANASSTLATGDTNGYAFSASGVAMLGFDFVNQVVIWKNMSNSAFGWSTCGVFNITANSTNVNNFEAVEVVLPNQVDYESDRGACRIANGYGVSNLSMVGCYFAPAYKASGSSAHCDTWQHSRSSGAGTIGPVLWEDCILFQSSSQVMMYEVTGNMTLKHTALIGGLRATGRFPIGGGRHVMVGQNTLWGGSTNATAIDSFIMGAINSSHSFALVTNTVTGTTPSSSVASGAFTVDSQFAAYDELETAWLNTNAPVPVPATIWAAL